MNLSGILVVVTPERTPAAAQRLAALPGMEVYHTDAASGRIVVIQEAGSVAEEVDGLKRIKSLPWVILAEMVYHYFEEDSSLSLGPPPELDAMTGIQVPDQLKTT
jgi:nitrate reductase NapD